jgi:hypothetical protein
LTRVLTFRELNRATLARQMLLEREKLAAPAAVEKLVGLQSQVQNPPYIGLWTRLADFQKADLTGAMERREVVRASLMRSTIHLMTARDYLQFRPALQPALTKGLQGFHGKRIVDLAIASLVEAAREFFAEKPRTFAELRPFLIKLEPERDPDALAYVIRAHLPLVQVFPGGTWGFGGNVYYALPEDLLKDKLATADNTPELIRRYLAAFGPASAKDVQTWAGVPRLKEAFDALKPEMRSFRDEAGNELLDLPDASLPDTNTPAPVRFIPDYDNLVLSHFDRSRFVPTDFRKLIFPGSAIVRATFLVDGFCVGTWKVEKVKGKGKDKTVTARLIIEPFQALKSADRAALTEEGEKLIRFIDEAATNYEVTFAEPVG